MFLHQGRQGTELKTILHIANDSLDSARIAHTLQQHSLRVCFAKIEDEACSVAATKAIDLILADWDVSGLNGQQIITRLRRNHTALAATPAILLTDRKVSEGTRIDLSTHGFHRLLQKPLVSEILVRLIHQATGNWKPVAQPQPQPQDHAHAV
jgi:DNA-binding response OmpR family regulator